MLTEYENYNIKTYVIKIHYLLKTRILSVTSVLDNIVNILGLVFEATLKFYLIKYLLFQSIHIL